MSTRGFPRRLRLRRRPDFVRVQRSARRLSQGLVVTCWSPRPGQGPRFGITVSKRVGNAVTRNRVKRWLREAIRHERGELTGVDVVFIARPEAATAGYEPLHAAVATALSRVGRST